MATPRYFGRNPDRDKKSQTPGTLADFATTLTGKNRVCPQCSKKIHTGESVHARKLLVEKTYPVKGIMKFVNWQFFHPACWDKMHEDIRNYRSEVENPLKHLL